MAQEDALKAREALSNQQIDKAQKIASKARAEAEKARMELR